MKKQYTQALRLYETSQLLKEDSVDSKVNIDSQLLSKIYWNQGLLYLEMGYIKGGVDALITAKNKLEGFLRKHPNQSYELLYTIFEYIESYYIAERKFQKLLEMILDFEDLFSFLVKNNSKNALKTLGMIILKGNHFSQIVNQKYLFDLYIQRYHRWYDLNLFSLWEDQFPKPDELIF